MPSKAIIKQIRSLSQKKQRNHHKLFVVEGQKSVNEFLNGKYPLVHLFYTENIASNFKEGETVLLKEMEQMTQLKNHQHVLAVFRQKEETPPQLNHKLSIALDNIQDPGNLGTIIRLADWFGIENILCNTHSVDVYNPKVIQASMGSLNRVKIHYLDLANYLQKQDTPPVYGTFLDGKNIYKQSLSTSGIIVLGNEGKGISAEVEKHCTNRISIPQNPLTPPTESLNVATATAITLSEFCRDLLS